MSKPQGYTQAVVDILNSQLGQSITQAFTAGEEHERERILAMKKDIINCVIDYGLTPEVYERVCNDIEKVIKGETNE